MITGVLSLMGSIAYASIIPLMTTKHQDLIKESSKNVSYVKDFFQVDSVTSPLELVKSIQNMTNKELDDFDKFKNKNHQKNSKCNVVKNKDLDLDII